MDVPYSEAQTYKYLHRIHFPLSEPPSYPPATLETLRRLVACHLHAIPFEDLSLHYSVNPKVTVAKDLVFDKFVNQRRGGYCMEQNRAFSDLLQTLGYDAYTVGARVHMGNENGFGGFAHMAIIVTLDGTEYLTDVGFGGNGLTAPIPIFDGEDIIETPNDGVMPEQHRVTRGVLPHARKRGYQSWLLQSRRNIESEWEMIYAFEKDFEFFPRDYEV
jgi:arylamine N-acetyltransferase